MPNIDVEVRVFRRYPRDISFVLRLDRQAFSARTVDYSFNSLGIIIEEAADIKPDDIVGLDIDELGIHQCGKVLWVIKQAQTIRAGIVRLGTLTGNFKDYHLSDIFIGFQRTLKAGVLSVNRETLNKKVFIKNGDIIFAASNQNEDRIGDILLKEGLITREQYLSAAERKRSTHERYVVILVDSGILKPAELLRTIELQASRIIESLFLLKDADFEFVEGPLSSQPPVTLRLSVANLIYREVKKTADTELLEKYLLDTIVDFSPAPLNLFQNIKLDASDRTLISFVDGTATIRELIRLSSLDARECLRSFFALLESRILVTKELNEAPQGITAQVIDEHAEKNYGDQIDVIDEMHAKHKRLDYYMMLGIARNAGSDEIKKAYFRAARDFHPDMHLDLPSDLKQKLVDIFVRINNAYLTLKDHEKRLAYNAFLQSGRPAVTAAPEKTTGFSVPGEESEKQVTAQETFSPAESANAEIAVTKYEEGKMYFRREKMEEAEHHFASAIYFDSSRPEYHYYYGYTLEKLGRLKESIHALSRALEMAPRNADILAELGHVYLQLNCPLRARGSFERALKLVSGHKRAEEGIEVMKGESKKKKQT